MPLENVTMQLEITNNFLTRVEYKTMEIVYGYLLYKVLPIDNHIVAKFLKICFKLNIDSINLTKSKYKKITKLGARMRCCDCTYQSEYVMQIKNNNNIGKLNEV